MNDKTKFLNGDMLFPSLKLTTVFFTLFTEVKKNNTNFHIIFISTLISKIIKIKILTIRIDLKIFLYKISFYFIFFNL